MYNEYLQNKRAENKKSREFAGFFTPERKYYLTINCFVKLLEPAVTV